MNASAAAPVAPTAAPAPPVPAASPSRTTGYAWFVAGMLSLAYLLSILDRFLLGVVLEDVKSTLALTDTQLGILQGPSFVLLFLVASIPLGWLADAGNRKLAIVGGLTVWSLATAACGMADSFAELMVARLMIGLGEAALLPASMSLIVAYFSRDRLNRGISIFSAGSSLGRAAAFAGGGLVFAWFTARDGIDLPGFTHFEPWQCVFLVAGLIGLAFAMLFLATVREPARTGAAAQRTSLASGFGHFWRNRWAYLAIFIPFGMTSAIAALLAAWSVSFYLRNHDMDVAAASSLIGLTGLVFGPAGHLLGGWVNDFLRARGIEGAQPWVLACTLTSSALLAAFFALTESLTLAAIAYAIAYLMLCASGPTGFGGVQLPTPDNMRGVMSSIFLLVYNAIGTATGPLLVGVIGDLFFAGPDQLGRAIAASLALLVACGLPFALLGRAAYRRAVQAQEAKQTPQGA